MLGFLLYLRARRARRATYERSIVPSATWLEMSDAKLRRLSPSLYFSSGPLGLLRCFLGDGLAQRHHIRGVLYGGAIDAAVVLSVSPLLVACYCSDIDGVCVLRFHDDLASEHDLKPGDHMLTILNLSGIHSACRATLIGLVIA